MQLPSANGIVHSNDQGIHTSFCVTRVRCVWLERAESENHGHCAGHLPWRCYCILWRDRFRAHWLLGAGTSVTEAHCRPTDMLSTLNRPSPLLSSLADWCSYRSYFKALDSIRSHLCTIWLQFALSPTRSFSFPWKGSACSQTQSI